MLDRALKARNQTTCYHWPANLAKNVKEIRSQLSSYVDDDYDLRNAQIMIRPNETGNLLMITYRYDFDSEWMHLENVSIPAPQEWLAEKNLEQPCKSDFFQL